MAPKKNILPPDVFFSAPIYDTRSLGVSLSQEAVEKFADKVTESSLMPGVILLDFGWQSHNGSYRFDCERFPNPQKMIETLHSKGYKVLLQVTPLVSMDCLEFGSFLTSKMLKITSTGTPVIKKWYGGYSACFDIQSKQVIEYIESKLREVQSEYGVDGFSFTLAGSDHYDTPENLAKELKPWTALASSYNYNLISEAYQETSIERIVGQITDYNESSSWSSLKNMLTAAINAGICGYPFISSNALNGNDDDLYIRSVQMQAFLPSMHLTYVPWEILSKDKVQIVASAVKLHQEVSPYIKELAKLAAKTGEPIIRSMEYNFPGKGFYNCDDQFMLGTKYLVTPILSKGGKRNVRLPSGTWIDDTGKRYKGPVVIKINAEIDRIPYFKAAKEIKLR